MSDLQCFVQEESLGILEVLRRDGGGSVSTDSEIHGGGCPVLENPGGGYELILRNHHRQPHVDEVHSKSLTLFGRQAAVTLRPGFSLLARVDEAQVHFVDTTFHAIGVPVEHLG